MMENVGKIDNYKVIPLTSDLVERAAWTCTRAFKDDPEIVYLIPDSKKRENLRFSFAHFLQKGVKRGSGVYITSPLCEGVSIWYHSRSQPDQSLLLSYNPMPALRCGWKYFWNQIRSLGFVEKLRKQYAPHPHLYLAILAVDPAYQGKGFASRLLRAYLQDLEKENLPGYIETQNMKNVNMYRRFGFELVHEVVSPYTGYPTYLMVRPARSDME